MAKSVSNNIFNKNILTTKIQLTPQEYNESIDETILEKLKDKVEGKCDSIGYIKPDSVKVVNRGMGEILQGQFNGSCVFYVKYSVDVCSPVEGDIVKCIVININKMGLLCELPDIKPSPLNLILAKQHHMKNSNFEKVKINDIIEVEIIGVRIEYNEDRILCIGVLHNKDDSYEDSEVDEEIDDSDNEVLEEEMELGDNDDYNDNNNNDLDDDTKEDDNNQSNSIVDKLSKDIPVQLQEDKNISELDQVTDSVDEENEIVKDDFELAEGVQDLESVELISSSDGSVEDKSQAQNMLSQGDSDLEDLGEEFMGESLDLEEISTKKLIPVYNDESLELNTEKLGKEVFDLDIKLSKNYKTFTKPRKNSTKYINYYIYVQLNNMMIEFYNKNGCEPKKIFVGANNTYKNAMKKFLSVLGKSLTVEDTDGISYVN